MAVAVRSRTALVLAGALIVCSGLFVPLPARAATGGLSGVTMSPTLKELQISSGLIEAHSTIVLTNHNQQDLPVSLRAVDMSDISNSLSFGGQSSVSLSRYGLASWMTLPNGNQLTIPHGQTVSVPVVVTNRSDLTPGGHYGAVVVSAGASDATKNTVGFKQELVSLVFVTKLGGEQYGLELHKITPDGGSQPDTVTLSFRGAGNVHVVPRGEVRLEDARGKLLSKGIINPESTIVLPGAERQFVTLMKPVASSNAPGRYKLTVYFHPDGVNQMDMQSVYLAHWPWWLTVLIAAIITLLVVIGRRQQIRRRSYKVAG